MDGPVRINFNEPGRAAVLLFAWFRDEGQDVVEADIADNPAERVDHREIQQSAPSVALAPVVSEWMKAAVTDLILRLDPHLKCGYAGFRVLLDGAFAHEFGADFPHNKASCAAVAHDGGHRPGRHLVYDAPMAVSGGIIGVDDPVEGRLDRDLVPDEDGLVFFIALEQKGTAAPRDGEPPGQPVDGTLVARIAEHFQFRGQVVQANLYAHTTSTVRSSSD